jgi:hypothetical protein
MATKQDRIAGLLAQGMAPSLVASLVNVDPSYISQLLKDEAFLYCLQELKTELAEEAIENLEEQRHEEALYYIDRLAATEHSILDKITKELSYMTGREALLALDVVGKRREAMQTGLQKQKALSGIGDLPPGSTVRLVEIEIPNICVPELTFTDNREIIAIGNKSVNPMPAARLQKILSGQEVTYENHADIAASL